MTKHLKFYQELNLNQAENLQGTRVLVTSGAVGWRESPPHPEPGVKGRRDGQRPHTLGICCPFSLSSKLLVSPEGQSWKGSLCTVQHPHLTGGD